jgi:hypothetical protein
MNFRETVNLKGFFYTLCIYTLTILKMSFLTWAYSLTIPVQSLNANNLLVQSSHMYNPTEEENIFYAHVYQMFSSASEGRIYAALKLHRPMIRMES